MGLILVVVPKGVGLMLVVGAEGRGGDVGRGVCGVVVMLVVVPEGVGADVGCGASGVGLMLAVVPPLWWWWMI